MSLGLRFAVACLDSTLLGASRCLSRPKREIPNKVIFPGRRRGAGEACKAALPMEVGEWSAKNAFGPGFSLPCLGCWRLARCSPKPRVESSNLSAPAKNPPDFARNRADLLLFATVRGLPESSCRPSRGQIVQSVPPVLNLSVWYSIKIASKALGALQNSALKKRG